MKKIYVLLAIISLLLGGCSKEYDEVLDESVLSELPSFEYAGYTYYVHPHLTVHYVSNSDSYIKYKNIEKEVQSLDSYGYHSWFIPSMNELEQAAKEGYLPTMFDARTELYYISSSQSHGTYQCLVRSSGSSVWTPFDINSYSGYYTVRPMIKFRKQ